jgi:hypothetical protein
LKEGTAGCVPDSFRSRLGAPSSKQRAGQSLKSEHVCTRRQHELAQLLSLARLQLLRTLIQRVEF